MTMKKLYGDLQPIFGLEDTRGFGRNFASYLLGHKYTVKHVNPAYTDTIRRILTLKVKFKLGNENHELWVE